MDRWMDEWMDGYVGEYIEETKVRWISVGNEWVDGWIILTDVWLMGEWVVG